MNKKKISLIPRPNGVSSISATQRMLCTHDTMIHYDPLFSRSAGLLQNFVFQNYNLDLPLSSSQEQNSLGSTIRIIKQDEGPEGSEAYTLSCTQSFCEIRASSVSGAAYGVQTVKQLMVTHKNPEIPVCSIEDYPNYGWRGIMLDSARSFIEVDEIFRLLDILSQLKFNRVHWHLTDDQGWRIEIKSYPELTVTGAFREGYEIRSCGRSKMIPGRNGGFYSQDDVRRIISYAEALGILMVPEIDVPGHIVAALAAYPELSCSGGPFTIPPGSGIFEDLLCLGNPDSLTFIYSVIDEICELFTAPWIHLGGDEISTEAWRTCPACQNRMKELGLRKERDLHIWFCNIINDYIKKKGKTLILWNDCMDDALTPDALCQIWTPQKELRDRALSDKRQFIFSDYFYTYLDLPHRIIGMKQIYQYSLKLKKTNKKSVLGIESMLWTEWIQNRESRDTHLFPRLIASSEVAWTREGARGYSDFKRRLKGMKRILKSQHHVVFTPPWRSVSPALLVWISRCIRLYHVRKNQVDYEEVAQSVTETDYKRK